jgi:hypothetical protein
MTFAKFPVDDHSSQSYSRYTCLHCLRIHLYPILLCSIFWNNVLGLVLGQPLTSDQCLYYPRFNVQVFKGRGVFLYLKRLASDLTAMDSIER